MSHRSNVKIRLKKEDYNKIYEEFSKLVKEAGYPYNLLDNVDNKIEKDCVITLTWHWIKWHLVEEDLMELVRECDNYSYARIGEELTDIEEEHQGEDLEPIEISVTFAE